MVSAAQDPTGVTKESVPGIRNLARLETTVACAGAITPEAVADIKKMGFVSIVNLRLASEPGAEVEKEEAAAKAAGLSTSTCPFDGKPDPKAAGAFLDAITTQGAEPAFIHCAGGNRAATMWLIKRMAVDHWDVGARRRRRRRRSVRRTRRFARSPSSTARRTSAEHAVTEDRAGSSASQASVHASG